MNAPKPKGGKVSRRDFLKAGAVSAAAFGPFCLFPERSRAQQKTLKIAKWAHFLPEYDRWFESVVAKNWGAQHDTKVIVENIPVERVYASASSEVKEGHGHDLFMFPWPPPEFQQHAIDHAQINQTLPFN